HSARATQGKAAGVPDQYYQQLEDQYYEQKRDEWDHEDDPNSPQRLLRSTLSSALEELPADFSRDWEYLHAASGAVGVYLVYTKDPDDDPVALYAVSDDPAPRIVRLARNARPLALSRDGRTLFFERHEALWRIVSISQAEVGEEVQEWPRLRRWACSPIWVASEGRRFAPLI